MFINKETGGYETGDDDDDPPVSADVTCDAFPSNAPIIVVSQRALTVASTGNSQRCNLFQTKALVGQNKACKVIIDGGSCRNLASKELCAKLKLQYIPHPHPYYVQWLSDKGEMKVSHMVRVNFEIGPYMDSIEFDVVPMTVCHLLLGRPWLYDRSVQHNGRANTYHLEFKGKMITLHPMTPEKIVNECHQKAEAHLEPSLVQESDVDVVPQHSLCSLMQPLFIGDGGASRSTPFEGGGDDEDIPDQAKDPGGEAEPQEVNDEDTPEQAKDPGGEAEPQEVKAKKSPASGRGTTALATVLPRHGTTVPYYRTYYRAGQ